MRYCGVLLGTVLWGTVGYLVVRGGTVGYVVVRGSTVLLDKVCYVVVRGVRYDTSDR